MAPVLLDARPLATCGPACSPGAAEPRTLPIGPRERALLAAAATPSGARQDHGFRFETAVISLLGLTKSAGHTARWDAVRTSDRGLERFSFKTARAGGSLMLADLRRNAWVEDDCYMVVGLWAPPARTLVRVAAMHVRADFWRSLFPADVRPFLQAAVFEGISNDHADDARWTARRKELRRQWGAQLPEGSGMQFYPKRDHKTKSPQHRVQCGVTGSAVGPLLRAAYCPSMTAELAAALHGEVPRRVCA